MDPNAVGALVKYNPCSVYAREGSVCPFFKSGSKRCSKAPLSCEMPEYDKWFKDVVAGKVNSYPSTKRRRLLEIPGVPLFFYHSHERKIVGESTIDRVTKKNKLFHYWFAEFLLYPHFVDLSKLKTDKSLQGLMRKGRSSGKYLNEETIKEIRNLSGLPTHSKKRLADNLGIVKQRIADARARKTVAYVRAFEPSKFIFVRSKLKEIGLKLQVEETVINKAQEIFSNAKEKGMIRGRAALDVACASLFAACKVSKNPVRIEDISRLCDINPKKLLRLYRIMQRILELVVPVISADYLVSKYSQRLPISRETVELAISLAKSAKKLSSLHRSPVVIAATVVYIASIKHNETITQPQIARIFGIRSESIRNCLKDLNSLT